MAHIMDHSGIPRAVFSDILWASSRSATALESVPECGGERISKLHTKYNQTTWPYSQGTTTVIVCTYIQYFMFILTTDTWKFSTCNQKFLNNCNILGEHWGGSGGLYKKLCYHPVLDIIHRTTGSILTENWVLTVLGDVKRHSISITFGKLGHPRHPM